MVYSGSKARLLDWLMPHLQPYITGSGAFLDLFTGSGSVVSAASHSVRLACDINPYLIAVNKKLAEEGCGWVPDNPTREEWDKVNRNRSKYPDWYVGFYLVVCAFQGKAFAGMTSGQQLKNAVDNLRYPTPLLEGVKFFCADYRAIDVTKLPANTCIYADPPYANTVRVNDIKYNTRFDSKDFYRWCALAKRAGHTVLLSEYVTPVGFQTVSSVNHLYHAGCGEKRRATGCLSIYVG